MDLLQVQYVVAMVENESMTAAANKMFVSQSAVSMAYKKLEEELGIRLFEKRGRKLILTDAGKVFYEKAKVVLNAMDDLKYSMRDILTEQEQAILVCTEAVDFTNEAIKIFSRVFPDIFYQQVRGSTEEIKSMLKSRAANFAITLSPDFGPGTESHLLLEEPMYLLTKSDSPYAGKTEVSISELAKERIITLRDGLAINQLFHSFFAKAGIYEKGTLEVSDPETIVIQVENGFGVSFIPESIAYVNILRKNPAVNGVTAIPITEEWCKRQVYLVTAKGHSLKKRTQQFIDYLIRFGTYTQDNRCMPSYENRSLLLGED